MVEWAGIDLEDLSGIPEARLVEDPEPLIGCTFEVVWSNGLGVTLCRQLSGPVDVALEEMKSWAQTTDPLFDCYILDAVNRDPGDSWKLDGATAVQILSSQGASSSAGELQLKYLRDGEFDGQACRQLAIQSGRLSTYLNRSDRDTEVQASNIQGQIFYDKRQYLVLQANGTCHMDVEIRSRNHLLFEANWKRDVRIEFRYEARVHQDDQSL